MFRKYPVLNGKGEVSWRYVSNQFIAVIDVPKNGNIVIVVRIDESVQAPHAIQNSTRIYVRTGSITQPYELAIALSTCRREDSRGVTQQILESKKDKTGI